MQIVRAVRFACATHRTPPHRPAAHPCRRQIGAETHTKWHHKVPDARVSARLCARLRARLCAHPLAQLCARKSLERTISLHFIACFLPRAASHPSCLLAGAQVATQVAPTTRAICSLFNSNLAAILSSSFNTISAHPLRTVRSSYHERQRSARCIAQRRKCPH